MLLHCPKCCPKKWQNVHGVTGSVSHSWEPIEWQYEYADVANPHLATKAIAVEPWGWKCDNCGHFKKPRKKRK